MHISETSLHHLAGPFPFMSGRGRRCSRALVLGIAALAAWSWGAAAGPAHAAAIPEYEVFPIKSPDPQSEFGTGGPTNPNPLGSAFGERIRALGDVNRDGVRDLLVSNVRFDRNGLTDVGRMWIFSGRTRALLRTIDHPDPQTGAQFGFWSARLGDVNADGTPDFVTSASGQTVGGVRQGQVYVISGQTGAALRTLNHPDAPQLNGDFGGNIIAPGDLNSDGVSDFVATASGTLAGSGAGYAFSGSTGALLYKVANPDLVQKSSFGFGASELGDVNADGVGDYQLGSLRHDVGTGVNAVVDVGRSYTINGETGAVLFTLDNPDVEAMARFGQADADGISLGDITGDRKPDIFIDGFLSDDAAFLNAGAVYLFNGANGQFIRALRDPNPVASGSFGASNASAGDIDRDGRPDQLISSRGAIGRVTVFGGPNLTSVLTSFADPQAQRDALFGTGLAYLGDVNGDRLPDYFVSSRSADVDGAVNIGIAWAFVSKAPPVYPVPKPGVYPGPGPGPTIRIRPRAVRPQVSAVQRKRRRSIRVAVRGRLTGTAGRACAGGVTIAIRTGNRRLGTVRTRMGSNCRFSKSARVSVRRLPRGLRPRGRRVVLRVSYRFLGNAGLLPDTSPTARTRVKR